MSIMRGIFSHKRLGVDFKAKNIYFYGFTSTQIEPMLYAVFILYAEI